MHPQFFGTPALFGVHHPPGRVGAENAPAVLICPPIGHEHTRAHRALRVASLALARAGHHVLRFDYRGIGDSWGDMGDGVDAWCDDIACALERLSVLAQTRTLGVVGLRVGATLAVRALARPGAPALWVRKLVLWDPVLRGDDFLRVATALSSAFFNDPGRFPALARVPAPAVVQGAEEDLLGYAYPPALRASLRALDLTQVEPWPDVATTVLLSEPSKAGDALVQRLRSAGRTARSQVVIDAEGAWDDYHRHELSLRAGRIVPSLVASLTA